MVEPEHILHFWFVEAGADSWWKKSDAFDAEVRTRFESDAITLAGQLQSVPHAWEARLDHSLALIIALDQFPRNMYRDTSAAFAWDHLALGAAERLIEKGWDLELPEHRRQFVYMPLMHAEDLDRQNQCVELFKTRMDQGNNLFHAEAHRDLIKKFGRFPHRNSILGRKSTPEETAFLDAGGYSP